MFTEQFKTSSYWLDTVPQDMRDDTSVDDQAAYDESAELPAEADVLVVGSGYTGLCAALVSARAGLSTVVVDTAKAGHGCSTRNGGQISTSIKPTLAALSKKYGDEKAVAIRAEGAASLQWIEEFINAEAIDCDFRRSGRFHAAHSVRAFDRMARDVEQLAVDEHINAWTVSKSDVHSELGTDAYHGGVVFADHAQLNPAKYHAGLLQRVRRSGARIVPGCAALSIGPIKGHHEVRTTRGNLSAKQVVVATNGYSGELLSWIQRRVIPVGSYIIATEELPESTIQTLFPTNRIASDSCKVVYYYRPSPDQRRVIFGGRVSAGEVSASISGPRLYRKMVNVFPQLKGCRISHSWSGTVAYTFDELAHVGERDGVHYALGYCGSGVAMAGYLGTRIGQKIVGDAAGATAFDNLAFPSRPLYRGKPWFLPAVVEWYRLQDRLGL